jgi:hypothetical protein
VIACSGTISIARSAAEKMRDQISKLNDISLAAIEAIVADTVDDLWKGNVYPYLKDQLTIAPIFNLIVGIEVDDEFSLLLSDLDNLTPIDSFAFQGTGVDIAVSLVSSLIESPGNSILTFPASVGAHMAIEVLRVAKLYGSAVGLDSEIIAWRSSKKSYSPFTQPGHDQPPNSDLGAIQENLKSAIWDAFEKSNVSPLGFDAEIQNIVTFLRAIRAHTEAQGNSETRFARYLLSRTNGIWRMADLEPNVGMPSLGAAD